MAELIQKHKKIIQYNSIEVKKKKQKNKFKGLGIKYFKDTYWKFKYLTPNNVKIITLGLVKVNKKTVV